MVDLLFILHIFVVVIFLVFYLFAFNKHFVKTNRNTNLVKIKISSVLFIWSFFSFLGIILLFPGDSQNKLQEVCGMFWLAEIAAFFVFVILEMAFLIIGFILAYIVKNLSHTTKPIDIFSN